MKLKITFLALLLGGSAMAQVPLKVVATKGDTLKVEDATRITYSDDLSEQIIHTASGEEQKQALNNIWQVIFADTLHNLVDFLAEDDDTKIFAWAMHNGGSYGGRYSPDYMKMHHYANFQADGHQFAFFAPVDGYSFPRIISFNSARPQVCQFTLKDKKSDLPITYSLFRYDVSTGEIGASISTNLDRMDDDDIVNEMQYQLLQHTVLLDHPLGFKSGNEYYKTLAGTYIRVDNENQRVQGGYQMQNEAAGFNSFTHSQIVEAKQKQNGTIYKLDTPILPPAKSVYDVLSANSNYEEFLNLCIGSYSVIQLLCQQASPATFSHIWGYYCNFDSNNNNGSYASSEVGLSLFPRHEFTLYVPTNEAIRQAIAEGLPTWENIIRLVDSSIDAEGNLPEDVRSQVQAQVEELLNFVRYHFHFGSEVADKLPFAARSHNTPVVLRENLTTPKLTVSSKGNGTLSVTDALGNVRNVVGSSKNMFVREVWTNKGTVEASVLNGVVVTACSPGVIHQIDGVLRYK